MRNPEGLHPWALSFLLSAPQGGGDKHSLSTVFSMFSSEQGSAQSSSSEGHSNSGTPCQLKKASFRCQAGTNNPHCPRLQDFPSTTSSPHWLSQKSTKPLAKALWKPCRFLSRVKSLTRCAPDKHVKQGIHVAMLSSWPHPAPRSIQSHCSQPAPPEINQILVLKKQPRLLPSLDSWKF